MKQVIRILEVSTEESKPVEFTHYLSRTSGWSNTSASPKDFDKIIYLQKSRIDGDMFAAYEKESITIYKGHLNSGKY